MLAGWSSVEHSEEGWGAPAHRGTKRCHVAPKSRENSRRTGLAEELSAVQPTFIWRDINIHNISEDDEAWFVSWMTKYYDSCFGNVVFKVRFVYLKLDNSVLIYVNVPGGDGVFSKLAGDKHHCWLILLPVPIPHKKTQRLVKCKNIFFKFYHHHWALSLDKNKNTVKMPSLWTVKCFSYSPVFW